MSIHKNLYFMPLSLMLAHCGWLNNDKSKHETLIATHASDEVEPNETTVESDSNEPGSNRMEASSPAAGMEEDANKEDNTSKEDDTSKGISLPGERFDAKIDASNAKSSDSTVLRKEPKTRYLSQILEMIQLDKPKGGSAFIKLEGEEARFMYQNLTLPEEPACQEGSCDSLVKRCEASQCSFTPQKDIYSCIVRFVYGSGWQSESYPSHFVPRPSLDTEGFHVEEFTTLKIKQGKVAMPSGHGLDIAAAYALTLEGDDAAILFERIASRRIVNGVIQVDESSAVASAFVKYSHNTELGATQAETRIAPTFFCTRRTEPDSSSAFECQVFVHPLSGQLLLLFPPTE